MRVHGNFNKRFFVKAKKTVRGTSTNAMVVSGGSIYSEQLSKTVSNMPELNKQFGGLMSKKKTKKIFLKI